MVSMKEVIRQLNTSWYDAMIAKFPRLENHVAVIENSEKNLALPAMRIFPVSNPSMSNAMDLNGTENAVLFTAQVEFYEGSTTWSTLYDYDEVSHAFFESEGYERVFGPEIITTSNVVHSVCRYRKLITATT